MNELFIKIKSILSIPRPQLFTIPATSGVCGYVVSSGSINFFELFFSMIIPVFIWSGGQILNDYFDSDFDKIYHPEWPIPSGIIKKKAALIYSFLFYFLGFIFSTYFNIYCVIVTLITAFFSIIYNKLKRKGIYGNVCFGICVSLCLLLGSTINGGFSDIIWIIMSISILIHTVDNIIGTFADTDADNKIGYETLSTNIGAKSSSKICIILLFIAFVITLALSFFKSYYLFLPLALISFISLFWSSLMVYDNPKKFTNISGFWIVYSLFMGEMVFYMSFLIG